MVQVYGYPITWGRFIGAIGSVFLCMAIYSFTLMILWNWFMPAVLGINAIGFLPAVGLFTVGRILLRPMSGSSGQVKIDPNTSFAEIVWSNLFNALGAAVGCLIIGALVYYLM